MHPMIDNTAVAYLKLKPVGVNRVVDGKRHEWAINYEVSDCELIYLTIGKKRYDYEMAHESSFVLILSDDYNRSLERRSSWL